MKNVLWLIILFLVVQGVSASCSERQIDINTASAEELDEIIWVGPATAEKIISGRPFESVDSLIEVSGIGEVKLEAIKEQGLACVEDGEEKKEKKSEKEIITGDSVVSEEEEKEPENFVPETIVLSPQTIKSEEDKDFLVSDYARYGFVGFCVLLAVLLIIKRKKFNKNEFEE